MENKSEEKEMVTITLDEYEELLEAQRFLDCLEGAGVDNWQGYSEAVAFFEEDK